MSPDSPSVSVRSAIQELITGSSLSVVISLSLISYLVLTLCLKKCYSLAMQQEPHWKLITLDRRYNLRTRYGFLVAVEFSEWISYSSWINRAERQLEQQFGNERVYPYHNGSLRHKQGRWYAGFDPHSNRYRIGLRTERDWNLLILAIGEPE